MLTHLFYPLSKPVSPIEVVQKYKNEGKPNYIVYGKYRFDVWWLLAIWLLVISYWLLEEENTNVQSQFAGSIPTWLLVIHQSTLEIENQYAISNTERSIPRLNIRCGALKITNIKRRRPYFNPF